MRAAIYLPLFIATALAAPQERCPDGCKCTITPESEYMARCTSLEFLDFKKHPSITVLDLSNLNIHALPPKLKKMNGLRRLDLSGNRFTDLKNFPKLNKLTHLSLRDNQLTTFDAKHLPNSIEHLDLSHNHIYNFIGLTKLPKLKTLRLEGNEIDCDCGFAIHMDTIINKFEVILEDAPKCSSPSKLQGVFVSRLYCVVGEVLFDEDVANDEPIEEDYMISGVTSDSGESEDEGSGSGDGELIIPSISSNPDVPNCFYNCSTAAPVTQDDDLPRADIGKELVDVLLGTSTEKQEEEPPMGDPIDEEPSRDPVEETVVRKVAVKPNKETPQQEGSDKQGSARAALPTDLPTTSESPKSNSTTYIIVGALLLVMVGLIAYVVIRKKKNQPQGEVLDKVPPVEMKPLNRKPNGNDATTLPERTPLMNGQNGHTENGDAVKQAELPDNNQVDVRPKADDDTGVTPERVTVTAKELSSPKSPVLVQRRLEDDGRIVDHIVDPRKS